MAYNAYIVVPFATWAVAQVAKFAIASMRGRIDFRYLYSSGGMPSVHSAVVSSLVVTALLVDGPSSPIFGLAAILAAIVMYDSFGVRRASGEQAAAINMLIESLDHSKIKLEQPALRLREVLGHQPVEVTVGAVVGVVLGGVFNYSHLTAQIAFLQTIPKGNELYIYGGIFAIMIVAGLVQRFVLRARYPKSPTMKKLTRRVLIAAETTGLVGLLVVLLEYERASYVSWRGWVLLVLVAGAAWGISLFVAFSKTVAPELTKEANTARKLKWLGGKRKAKHS